MSFDLNGLEFVRGCELLDGTFFVACQDPEVNIQSTPHSGILAWTKAGEWEEIGMAPRITVDMTVNEAGDMAMLLDPHGIVTEVNIAGNEKSQIADERPKAEMRCIRRIENSVHVGGMARHSFSRSGGAEWQKSNDQTIEQFIPPSSFSGIDGFSQDEVYAAGWGGELWKNNGKTWRQIQSPTNVILNDICAGDDKLVAVGIAGQVLAGRHDEWNMIEHVATTQPFWSVRAYQGAYYLTTIDGIYKFENGELALFRGLDEGMRTTYGLSVGPSGLWSIGAQDIVLFDGRDWHTIGQS